MKDMIKECINLSVICLAAASLLAACKEDELVDGGSLPTGLYPVEIASVTIDGEDDVQPWGADAPQTRVVESGDGKTTWWQAGDIFYMKFEGGNDIGSYKMASDGIGIERVATLYWRSATQEETLISWLTQPTPSANGTLEITDQTSRLAYVCRAEETVKYNGGDITVNLKHQLAKVRVYVQGTGYEGDATGVTINNVPTSCTVTEGVPVADASAATGNIQMYKTTVNNAVCFEANVLPGTLGKANTFTVTLGDGTTQTFNRSGEQTLTAGETFTANLRLQKSGTESIDLSSLSAVKEISGNGTYFFYGTGTHGIKVTSGSPKIYLANAEIFVTSGHGIAVESGSPTIVIQSNVSVQASAGAGIYVSSGSVTIKSDKDNDRNSRLIAYGGSDDSNVYPGIGGATGTTIDFKDLYIDAHGTAKNDNHSPAIGALQPINATSPNPPKVNIANCYIRAYRVVAPGSNWRKSYANHIGQGGNADNDHDGGASNAPYYVSYNLNGGNASNSTLEGWTNDYQHTSYFWY